MKGIKTHKMDDHKTPPSRSWLKRRIRRARITLRNLLLEKGTPYADLGLDNPDLSDVHLIDAMMKHPVLSNRPLVVSPHGVKLCRPSEEVLDLMPAGQRGVLAKAAGEQVIDATGNRVTG